MENWKFSHSLAYIQEDNKIWITDQCDQESESVHTSKDDDFYVTQVVVNKDGTVSFPNDFIDLRQFNNSWTLINHILLIQEVAQKIGIDVKLKYLGDYVKSHQVVLTNIEPDYREILGRETLCGIDGVVHFKNKSWKFSSQEVKYTNIDSKITQETWSIEDLMEFTVGYQVAMQDAYKKEGLKGNYGQLDDQVKMFVI